MSWSCFCQLFVIKRKRLGTDHSPFRSARLNPAASNPFTGIKGRIFRLNQHIRFPTIIPRFQKGTCPIVLGPVSGALRRRSQREGTVSPWIRGLIRAAAPARAAAGREGLPPGGEREGPGGGGADHQGRERAAVGREGPCQDRVVVGREGAAARGGRGSSGEGGAGCGWEEGTVAGEAAAVTASDRTPPGVLLPRSGVIDPQRTKRKLRMRRGVSQRGRKLQTLWSRESVVVDTKTNRDHGDPGLDAPNQTVVGNPRPVVMVTHARCADSDLPQQQVVGTDPALREQVDPTHPVARPERPRRATDRQREAMRRLSFSD